MLKKLRKKDCFNKYKFLSKFSVVTVMEELLSQVLLIGKNKSMVGYMH